MSRSHADSVSMRWLIERGVWLPKASHAENMQRCAEFRQRFARLGAEPGKEWAKRIIDDYREGVVLPMYAVRLAFQALGIPEERQVLRKPTRPVMRPDARERQAGDVEVAF